MKKMPATSPNPSMPGMGSIPVGWRFLLWAVFFANTLFLVWACLDRYLAPRFFFLSAALFISIILLRKDLRVHADTRLHGFDLLLLGWYGLSLASVSWSMSWSEGIFYAQKTMLLFTTYWLLRQALLRNEAMVFNVLGQATRLLTGIVCTLLVVQIGLAFQKNGFNNEVLYEYASGVFGNKSLAAEFLFFLLIFNGLFAQKTGNQWFLKIAVGVLLVLILLIQVRTAYLALAVGAMVYVVLRAIFEQGFAKIFLKKILPAIVVVFVILLALISWKGRGSSIAERLNPLTYLQSVSANERRFIWYKTDVLNAEHYWLGVGSGAWKFWLPSKNISGGYRLAEENVVFTRAHNDYLEIRAEMGIVGASWFVLLFLAAAIPLFLRGWGSTFPPAARAWVGAGLAGYCAIQYFDFLRERIEFQMVLALLFACSAHGARRFWVRGPGIFLKKRLPFCSICCCYRLALTW